MSATINASLFANYFRATYVGRPIARGGGGDEGDAAGADGGGGDGAGGEGGKGGGEGGGAGVAPPAADAAPTVHIPGFTHPVTQPRLDRLQMRHAHAPRTARALRTHTPCKPPAAPAPDLHLHLHLRLHLHLHLHLHHHR